MNMRNYTDKKHFDNNILLTQTERLAMESRPQNGLKFARNKNVLVIGGSGSGKTQSFVKPNIMQMHTSYVISDPKNRLLSECGKMLAEKGNYKIKSLNLSDFSKSMHYNPFAYIRSEKDIFILVNSIIENTKNEHTGKDSLFWENGEQLLLMACIGYLITEAPENEKNFSTLLLMLESLKFDEYNYEYKNPVDIMFEHMEAKNPKHFAVKLYKQFIQAPVSVKESIVISCCVRLAPFNIPELRELTLYDELELDKLGEQKTALFVITPDTHTFFNFISSIMYSQIFNLLCDRADYVHGGRLPIHVRCIMDDFADGTTIPNFDKITSAVRSREISISLLLQDIDQLYSIYGKKANTIIGNCDSMLYLGGGSLGNETVHFVSQLLGNTSYSKIAQLDNKKCILQVRGVRPFFSNKFDIKLHKNYIFLSDEHKENAFDIEKYIQDQRSINAIKNVYEYSNTDDYDFMDNIDNDRNDL